MTEVYEAYLMAPTNPELDGYIIREIPMVDGYRKVCKGRLEGNIFHGDWKMKYRVYDDNTAKALDKDGNTIERIQPCHVCGKNSAWNSPKVDPSVGLQESPVWCNSCADDSDLFLVGVKQHLVNGQRSWSKEASKRGVCVHLDSPWPDGHVRAAWFNKGMTAIPKAHEKAVPFGNNENHNVEDFIDAMADKFEAGYVFCTRCDTELHETEVAGRPLFAGVACEGCWTQHKQHLEFQRTTGKVCGMCRQPYDNCCC